MSSVGRPPIANPEIIVWLWRSLAYFTPHAWSSLLPVSSLLVVTASVVALLGRPIHEDPDRISNWGSATLVTSGRILGQELSPPSDPIQNRQSSLRPGFTLGSIRQRLQAEYSTMADLIIGTTIMLGLSQVLFRYGTNVGRASSRPRSGVVACTTVVLLLGFAGAVHGRLFLTKVIPLSNVIVLGNWLPLGAAVLAGILYGQHEIPRWRRTSLAFMLLVAGWYTIMCNVSPLTGHTANRFHDGVCVQTSAATCAACSAVTLLDRYGIVSNEQEMARLCLTGRNGATMLGIYRGLKVKTRRTRFDVDVVQCDYEALQREEMWPMLVPLRLHGKDLPELGIGDDFARNNHCVVLFGFTWRGTAVIGDSTGNFVREWTSAELQRRWLGEGLRLVKRG